MYHSNAELYHCVNKHGRVGDLKVWDQRIPNQPILERQFLIGRPPVHHIGRPQTTNPGIGEEICWQITSPSQEHQSYGYWQDHLQGRLGQGLPTAQPSSQPRGAQYHPHHGNCRAPNKRTHRDWVHGINYDIGADSHLRRLDQYNPDDLLTGPQQQQLATANQRAVLRIHNNRDTGMYLDNTALWLNNPTRMINQEPLYYDHTSFIQQCSHSKGSPSALPRPANS